MVKSCGAAGASARLRKRRRRRRNAGREIEDLHRAQGISAGIVTAGDDDVIVRQQARHVIGAGGTQLTCQGVMIGHRIVNFH